MATALAVGCGPASAPAADWQEVERLELRADQGRRFETRTTLREGVDYRLRAEGAFSAWGGPPRGIDAVWCDRPGRCAPPQAWQQLRIDGKGINELRAARGEPPLPYDPGHAYTFELTGAGRPLELHLWDAIEASSAAGNTGAITVTLYARGPPEPRAGTSRAAPAGRAESAAARLSVLKRALDAYAARAARLRRILVLVDQTGRMEVVLGRMTAAQARTALARAAADLGRREDLDRALADAAARFAPVAETLAAHLNGRIATCRRWPGDAPAVAHSLRALATLARVRAGLRAAARDRADPRPVLAEAEAILAWTAGRAEPAAADRPFTGDDGALRAVTAPRLPAPAAAPAAPPAPTPPPPQPAPSQPAPGGGPGGAGLDTRVMAQIMLHDLGYAPGRDDGVVDAATRDAVRRFQRDAGLPVDGRVTPALVDHLFARLNRGGGETTVIGPAPPGGTD